MRLSFTCSPLHVYIYKLIYVLPFSNRRKLTILVFLSLCASSEERNQVFVTFASDEAMLGRLSCPSIIIYVAVCVLKSHVSCTAVMQYTAYTFFPSITHTFGVVAISSHVL